MAYGLAIMTTWILRVGHFGESSTMPFPEETPFLTAFFGTIVGWLVLLADTTETYRLKLILYCYIYVVGFEPLDYGIESHNFTCSSIVHL